MARTLDQLTENARVLTSQITAKQTLMMDSVNRIHDLSDDITDLKISSRALRQELAGIDSPDDDQRALKRVFGRKFKELKNFELLVNSVSSLLSAVDFAADDETEAEPEA